MQLLCLGLNHKTAPLAVRERVAFGPEDTGETVALIKTRLASADAGGVTEAMILSTCNRTEIYCAAVDPKRAADSVLELIEELKGVRTTDLQPHVYVYEQSEAARHVFRVVSGIDSMVLGETQIVGQFKKAVATARDVKGLGLMLNHLFQDAFTVAKEVRSSTAIGSNSVSLAAAAVRLSLRLFGNLSDSNVLFVGAGRNDRTLCRPLLGTAAPLNYRGQPFARTRPEPRCTLQRQSHEAARLAAGDQQLRHHCVVYGFRPSHHWPGYD